MCSDTVLFDCYCIGFVCLQVLIISVAMSTELNKIDIVGFGLLDESDKPLEYVLFGGSLFRWYLGTILQQDNIFGWKPGMIHEKPSYVANIIEGSFQIFAFARDTSNEQSSSCALDVFGRNNVIGCIDSFVQSWWSQRPTGRKGGIGANVTALLDSLLQFLQNF